MKKYRLANYIVQMSFANENLDKTFSDYLVSDSENPDVIIKIRRQKNNLITAQSQVLVDDVFKTVVADEGSYCFIYKQNLDVVLSKLIIDPAGTSSTIVLYVGGRERIERLSARELRIAIMNAFFFFLFSVGVFPLHSCGVMLNGRCILVSGPSQSGKSTIGKILVEKYGATYMGDDINACTSTGRVYSLPFSRVNNNVEATIGTVIFIGDKTFAIGKKEIEKELIESEFGMIGLDLCETMAGNIAAYLAEEARCFMISRRGQTEAETASLVYGLANGERIF